MAKVESGDYALIVAAAREDWLLKIQILVMSNLMQKKYPVF